MEYLASLPYALIIAGVGLSYARLLPAMIGWMLSALGVLSGLGLAAGVVFTGQEDLLLAVVLALPSFVAVPMVINDLRYPRINDVATNVETPPAFVAALRAAPNAKRDMSFPQKNGPIIREAYPNVRPLKLDEPLVDAFRRIESIARGQHGWRITRSDPEAQTLEGEATTSYFCFVDDFVIQVAEHEGRVQVDMRSKSRDGLVDAGKNSRRICVFFEQVENSTKTELQPLEPNPRRDSRHGLA